MQHSRPEHRMLDGYVHFSVSCCGSCRCHKLFGTAEPLLLEPPPSSTSHTHTCSLVHRHHFQELFTFAVRQLVVRLELGSQEPCTTFLHERNASVRGFPDEVRIWTVCKEDCLPITTAQILCLQQCFANVHDSESCRRVCNVALHVFSLQTQDPGGGLMQ